MSESKTATLTSDRADSGQAASPGGPERSGLVGNAWRREEA